MVNLSDKNNIIIQHVVFSPAAVSPTKLIRVASHFNPSFHGYSQQDSMDFIRLVLDRLHEELKYSVPAAALLEDGGSRKIRRKSGRLAMKNGNGGTESVIHKSVISETFGGILRSEVQCHKCNKVSIHFIHSFCIISSLRYL